MQTYGIVLAAGQGTRMKSSRHKVLHSVCGKPMIDHVVCALEQAGVDRLVTVVGHGADEVRTHLGDRSEYVLQAEQLGTGHAVMQTEALLGRAEGTTLVVNGDTPLVSARTLSDMVELHRNRRASVTILTARLADPTGYGRIIRTPDGKVSRIVEQKDCTPEEAEVNEINTGIYCFDNQALFAALAKVTNDNAQAEYYLTDVVDITKQAGGGVEGMQLDDPDEGIGVNNRVDLAEAEKRMRAKILENHMRNGVTVIDPDHTYVGTDVQIGRDTVLYPGTFLNGRTTIGENCEIGPNTEITDTELGYNVQVRQSVIIEAKIEEGTTVGPFAHIRPNTHVGPGAKVGDFVELKNTKIGEASKVPHLSYVGDAEIGARVNIGCGVITANYDGFNKHRTVIEDDAFVGSNANLIAPVKIGKGAFVVAGSTITDDVDEDGVAIARNRQTTKPGYASKLKNRIKNSGRSSSGG